MSLVPAGSAGHPLVGPRDRLSLLYRNDFDDELRQGRSQGPRGAGPLTAFADSMVPFHYRVVVDTAADGTRSARFPTRAEQQGGGEFYSWFQTYVACRGGLVEGDRLYTWTVHLPRVLQLDARCSYYENRHVFAVGIEDTENHLGLRFADDRTLVWVVGLGLAERTIGIVPLARALRPGEALHFSVAVRWQHDAVAVTVTADDEVIAASEAPVTSLARATVAVLSSSGNTVGSDTDATLFCRLSQVRVHAVEPAADFDVDATDVATAAANAANAADGGAEDDPASDESLVPPGFIFQR